MKKIHNIIKTINERFNKINFYGHTYLSEGDRFLYIMFHSELTDLKTYNSFYIKLLKEALKDKYNNLNECNITNLKPLEENDNYFFLEQHLFLGHIILLDSKDEKFYYLDCSNAPHRNTSLPPGDTSNSDAHDGLVESILINESLLRKRLKSSSIKSIGYTVGDVTKTNVNILYHEKMKNTKVLSKIKEKIENAKIDSLISLSDFETKVLKEKSLITSFTYTSRSSFVANSLINGKIVILIDGMPLALILPASFHSFLEYADNSLEHSIIRKVDRIFYMIAFITSLFLLGASTSLLAYTPDFIPLVLLNNIYNARQGISYPIQVELIIATIFFQLFRLAGSRNVSGNNNALIMVGSIIIGQVSVTSGIIGQEVLLICAISTISTYVISDNLTFNTSIFTLQSIIFIFSLLLGLIGFFISSTLVVIYLCDINFYQTNFINFRGLNYYLNKWRKTNE